MRGVKLGNTKLCFRPTDASNRFRTQQAGIGGFIGHSADCCQPHVDRGGRKLLRLQLRPIAITWPRVLGSPAIQKFLNVNRRSRIFTSTCYRSMRIWNRSQVSQTWHRRTKNEDPPAWQLDPDPFRMPSQLKERRER